MQHPATPAGSYAGRPAEQPRHVAIEDWDLLFDAVVDRLRRSFEDLHSRTGSRRRPTWAQARANVLECVQALDRLHLTATLEFARTHHPAADGQPSRRRPESAVEAGEFPPTRGDAGPGQDLAG